ncbi:MAG: hypothetical protein LJE59_08645 [Chromatiaceae bacterium]|jgi:hypothetical protein|nr:hypothetical protein [Chromatiaceae bacterium]
MTIIQDLYNIYDKEAEKYRLRRTSQGLLLAELRRNLAFLREGLREGLSHTAIIDGLEDEQYRAVGKQGVRIGDLQKKRLARGTYAGIREFERYRDWDTGKLIDNAYERIAILKKLARGSAQLELQPRLATLFKFLMVLLAHLEGRALPIRR